MASKASRDRANQANNDVCTSMWLTLTLLRDAIQPETVRVSFPFPRASIPAMLALLVASRCRFAYAPTAGGVTSGGSVLDLDLTSICGIIGQSSEHGNSVALVAHGTHFAFLNSQPTIRQPSAGTREKLGKTEYTVNSTGIDTLGLSANYTRQHSTPKPVPSNKARGPGRHRTVPEMGMPKVHRAPTPPGPVQAP